ncbi:MAG: TIGR03936 family radical SAM-associated protein [Propionibacteriaceae bacterium]|nr:TIGR03936 family radical SAM-associated protein [Propionibacteriaceae bacterium]
MARDKQPEQRRPPEAWILLRYTKLGPSRFMSARDVARVMERALKRAGVPVAYSSGFSPHQRVSYAFPAPTGASSQAEYMLVGLDAPMPASEVTVRLNQAMPTGMVVTATGTDKSPLPARLEVSTWLVEWVDGPSPGALARAVDAFLAAGTVVVDRRSKSGVKQQDVRAAVIEMTASPVLTMTLRQDEPLIRPSDVLAGLGLGECGPMSLTRQWQGNPA